MDEPNDDNGFDLESASLDKKLEERFPADFLNLIKKIANEVALVGLTEKEACMICDLDYTRFIALKQNEPLVRQLFERKNLEYKRILLFPLSQKARTDDKLAQWLLEARFPDDFNKKRRLDDGGEDMMGAAISWIQRGESSGPNQSGLIKETSGQAFVLKGTVKQIKELTTHKIVKEKGHILKRLAEATDMP